ncbi:MAG: NADH-quinone oxidoreductase subunit NuoK [Deltaproteobacteria bacterium]|nr:NADH-quinone oxidoreductase subunit NuoK [Deltaproteobacteria bacterium]
MNVPFSHLLIIAFLLFLMGLASILVRRNVIRVLIGVEIMLNAAGLVLVGSSALWNKVDGQLFAVFLMAIEAAEVALALALVIYLRRRKGTLNINAFNEMRG